MESRKKNQNVKVLCSLSASQPSGYAAISCSGSKEIDFANDRVVDVFVERDDFQIVDRLLPMAFNCSKDRGIHFLEMAGFPRIKKGILIQGCLPVGRSFTDDSLKIAKTSFKTKMPGMLPF